MFAGLQRDYSNEVRLGAEDGLRGEADVCRVSREQAGWRLKGSADRLNAGARLGLSSST